MSFVENLNRLMLENGTSNLALANALGVSDTAVGKWKKGEYSPSLDNAIAIAKFYGVSIDALAEYQPPSSSLYIRIPVIGTVSVWSVSRNSFWTEDYISITESEIKDYPREECYALLVRDDTLEPDYLAKSHYLIFHQQKQCADGDYVIIQKRDSKEILYKKLHWGSTNIELSAPHVRTIEVPRREVNNWEILGVLVDSYLPL